MRAALSTFITSALVLAATVAAGTARGNLTPLNETFAGATANVPLDSRKGWRFNYGEQTAPAQVMLEAGYRGYGARFNGKSSYRRELDSPAPLNTNDSYEFRMKLRVMAPNEHYAYPFILLGQNGGTSGLAIRFNGGKSGAIEDNTIEVSTGGEHWGSVIYTTINAGNWQRGQWYEVVLSGIGTSGGQPTEADTGETGEPIAELRVTELGEQPRVLVEGAKVYRTGTTPFDRIDTLVIGNSGAARAFDVDELTLVRINEQAATDE